MTEAELKIMDEAARKAAEQAIEALTIMGDDLSLPKIDVSGVDVEFMGRLSRGEHLTENFLRHAS